MATDQSQSQIEEFAADYSYNRLVQILPEKAMGMQGGHPVVIMDVATAMMPLRDVVEQWESGRNGTD